MLKRIASTAAVAATLTVVFACTNPPPAPKASDVISDAAACALAVIGDLSVTPTVELLLQTAANCKMSIEDLYASIANLVKTSPKTDGGAMASQKTLHLEAWLRVAQEARAR